MTTNQQTNPRPLAATGLKALFLSACLLVLGWGRAEAGGLDLLDQFLKSTQSGRAQFAQVVTSPPKVDSEGRTSQKTKTSSGQFAFQRPLYFLFEYQKPRAHTLLADGSLVWSLDFDLGQATSRKQSTTLASSPIALVATATSRSALEKDFLLAESPVADGLQWVLATPRSKDNPLASIRLGLRSSATGIELAAMEILDTFGQQSKLQFTQFQVNPNLDKSLFRAKLPPSMEISRQ
jgi:outer membrane lipoprotein carrier protein